MRNAVAVLLLVTTPALAQLSDWEALKTIRTGEPIWIRYGVGEKQRSAKGEMVGSTGDALLVRIGRSEANFARADVRVSVYAGKSRGKGASMGALIGGAAGAGTYGALAAAIDDVDSLGLVILGGGILFAGVGALIGLAVGSTKTKAIYESPGS